MQIVYRERFTLWQGAKESFVQLARIVFSTREENYSYFKEPRIMLLPVNRIKAIYIQSLLAVFRFSNRSEYYN